MDNYGWSIGNQAGYMIPLEGYTNMLTNMDTPNFTINELEVWEVEFIVKFHFKS